MQRAYRIESGAALEHSPAIEAAARVLKDGGLALIPTETVYGLAVAVSACVDGDASASAPGISETLGTPPTVNGSPVPAAQTGYRRIFALKQRELTQTIPWLVGAADDLDLYGIHVDARARTLAQAFWPGALTLVVPAGPRVPAFMQAADGTVALRASASPVVTALVRACGSPLACTSANSHGAPAPASFDAVESRILDGVDIALDAGATSCQDASTIVAFPDGALQILRHGALPVSDIEQALAGHPADAGAASARGR